MRVRCRNTVRLCNCRLTDDCADRTRLQDVDGAVHIGGDLPQLYRRMRFRVPTCAQIVQQDAREAA